MKGSFSSWFSRLRTIAGVAHACVGNSFSFVGNHMKICLKRAMIRSSLLSRSLELSDHQAPAHTLTSEFLHSERLECCCC